MEHIPTPSLPAFPRPKVPVLSCQQYDNIGFDTFPARHGFDQSRLLSGDFSEHQTSRTASFLQTWLYFGTLREVLGPVYGAAHQFVVAEEGFEHGVVSTALLEALYCKRMERLHALFYDDDPRTKTRSGQLAWETYFKMKSCLRKLLTFCSLATVSGDPREFPTRWPLTTVVDLSLRTLGHYLTVGIYPLLFRIASPDTASFRFPVAYLSIAQMAEASWCPSEVTMLTESYSPNTFHYMSEVTRSNSRLDHSTCSRRLCHARQVHGNYVTKHVSEGCTCLHIGPYLEKVLSIIRRKRIPLITIAVDKATQRLNLHVEAYNGRQKYVAFSHVWSDGLGNPTQNTLPQCQLIRLAGLLHDLASLTSTRHRINTADMQRLYLHIRHRSTPFWFDTLCIPSPGTHQEERVTALQLMKDTYEKSFQVLILDSELEASQQYSTMENFSRISVSGWMRRLWTLQEGVLGQRLYVKFRDGFFKLEFTGQRPGTARSAQSAGIYDPKFEIYYTVAPSVEVERILREMRSLRASIVEKREFKIFEIRETFTPTNSEQWAKAQILRYTGAIFEAFYASVHRSSSREDDEFTCLASLLGWDISGLRDLPMDDRMHHLLSQQKYLPTTLIFMAGTRMKREGWTWAIDRFGNRAAVQIDSRMTQSSFGTITAEGFEVGCPALVLPDSFDIDRHEDSAIFIVAEHETDAAGYMRITRHRDFEPKAGDGSPVTDVHETPTSRNSAAQFTTVSDVSYVVLFHSAWDSLVENVVRPAAVIAIARGIDHSSPTNSKTNGKFEHLAKLEYLGTDRANVGVLLRRRNSRIVLSQEHAKLLHKIWCVQ